MVDLNERVARLEQIAIDTQATVTEIRSDVKTLMASRAYTAGVVKVVMWVAPSLSALIALVMSYITGAHR
jgi:hypothetical protein